MLVTAAGLIALIPSPANAVTYGDLVSDPNTEAPYVVSIWQAADNDVADAEFICTGTLIAPHTVLTAAHCVLTTGSTFVKVGAETLSDSKPLIPVVSKWKNARYDAKRALNDIALFKIDTDIAGVIFPSLATPKDIKGINNFTKFKVYGWGIDQDKNLADLLRVSNLLNQDALATKLYKSDFNKTTMISAGRKITSENLWSGACNGDSGGPLVANVNGLLKLVGVTSWGAQKCLQGYPTVFSRVSYYAADIAAGIKAVEATSKVKDLRPPINVTAPAITGEIKEGNSITCAIGDWKNLSNSKISWISPARIKGNTSTSITVDAQDSGQTFTCKVNVSSQAATVSRMASATAGTRPIMVSPPSILGISPTGPLTMGVTARCADWNWATPVTNEQVAWYSTKDANPASSITSQPLSTNASLTLTAEIIRSERGKYLTCQVSGIANGFHTYSSSSRILETQDPPSIATVKVTASSLKSGATANCKYTATGEIASATIEWGTSPNGLAFNGFAGISGETLRITDALARQASGKSLACRVTLANNSGDASKIATSDITFDSVPLPPVVAIQAPTAWTPPNTLTCKVTSTATVTEQPLLTYKWGVTRAPASPDFTSGQLSSEATLNLTNNILIQAAGNYLTCAATASNAAGSTTTNSSLQVPLTAAPTAPTPASPTISLQTAKVNSVNILIAIPTFTNFDPITMDLHLSLPGTSCDNKKIDTVPTQITCSRLTGNTSLSAVVTNAYLGSASQQPSRSTATTFTTVAAHTLTLAPTALTAEELLVGTIAYLEDLPDSGVSCPTTNPVAVVGVGPTGATSQTTYTKCWKQPAIDAYRAGGTTWTDYLTKARGDLPDTVAPTVVAGTLSSSTISTEQAVNIPLTLTDEGGVTTCGVTIFNSAGSEILTNTSCTFITGTAINGSWRVTTSIPAGNNPGVYTVKGFAGDKAGNQSTKVILGTLTIPGPSVSNLIALPTPVTIGVNYTDQIVLNSFDWSAIAPIAPSSYTWTIRVTDNAGSIIKSVPVGSNQTYLTGLTQNTVYKVYLVATDSSGATKLSTPLISTTLALIVDLAPSITLSNSVQSVTVGKPLITVSATNSGGAVNDTGYSISPALPAGLTLNASSGAISGTPTQICNLCIYTVTATGKGGSATAAFTLTVIDSNPPVLVANSGILVAKVTASDSTNAVTFQATDDFGVSGAFIRVYNSSNIEIGTYTATRISGTPQAGTYASTFWFDPNWYSSGTYQVKVQLFDVDGKMLDWQLLGNVVISPVADTQSPTVVTGSVTLRSPSITGQIVSIPTIGNVTDGMSTNSDFSVSISVADNVGVSSVSFSVDSSGDPKLIGTVVPGTTGSATLISGNLLNGVWNYSAHFPGGLGCGRYSIRVTALDSAGNSTGQLFARPIDIVTCTAPPPPTMWQGVYSLGGNIIPNGRGGQWQIGINGAVSVSLIARASGQPDIVAPFSSTWNGNCVITGATTQTTRLYIAALYVPQNTPSNTSYQLIWTATNSQGESLIIKEGSFNTGP